VDLSRAEWRKSTRSDANSQCTEVARNIVGVVALRDSKDVTGPVLTFAPAEWTTFVAAVKSGEFDL
jgi:hypothetical protein